MIRECSHHWTPEEKLNNYVHYQCENPSIKLGFNQIQ